MLTEINKANFIAAAMKISAPRNTQHYTKAVDAYVKQYPGHAYPSAEWFRKYCIAHQITYPYVAEGDLIEVPAAPAAPMPAPETSNNEAIASQSEIPEPVIPESEPPDLTPADGLIRKYRAFLRLYRKTGGDQAMLDTLLDAMCPELWED